MKRLRKVEVSTDLVNMIVFYFNGRNIAVEGEKMELTQAVSQGAVLGSEKRRTHRKDK